VVVLPVPDEAQEGNPASHSQDARFPHGVPEDSRIALMWHALACMKADTGRFIEAAWKDLRMCRTHPCLQTVSGTTIAAQGYPFVPPAIPEPADHATPCQKAKP
jgi:hypothetical protein